MNHLPPAAATINGEGIVQMVFFQGDPCQTSYSNRAGKYQKQSHRITLPCA